MTYNELNIFAKYLYNQIDYNKFAEAIKASMPTADDGYIQGKWGIFKREPVLFIANYDKNVFEYLYNKMIKENYKG